MKVIPGFSNYSISIGGVVYSNRRPGSKGGALKPYINANGYHTVNLYNDNGNVKNVRVHRLMAQAFIQNPDNKPQVNHINGVKTDNRLENLEWASAKENTIHAFEHELAKPNGSKRILAENVLTGSLKVFSILFRCLKGVWAWKKMLSQHGYPGEKNKVMMPEWRFSEV
jgi:hypothetical protein